MPSLPDHLEITTPTGEVQCWRLDLARGISNIGRHAGNDIVLSAPTLQPFHFMLDHRRVPYQLIALRQSATARTMEPLADLHVNQPVEVAGHRFRLLPFAAAHRPPPAPPIAHALTAELSAREWSSEVGRTHTAHLTLFNHGPDEVPCALSAEGSAAPWLTLSPATLTVPAGGRAVIVLCLTPPRQPTSVAGSHPLTLLITPERQPDQALRREVTVRVQPFYEFTLGPLFPAKQSLSPFHATARATLPITNLSNTTATVRVEGTAVGGSVGFEFTAPDEAIPFAGAINLSLDPGESLPLPVTLLPPPRPTFGTQRQGHHFTLTATLLGERATRRSVGGLLITAPRVGPGVVSVLLVSLLLLALALPRLREPTPSALALAPAVEEEDDSSLLNDFEAGKLDEWLATHAPVPPTPLPTSVPAPGSPDAPLTDGFTGPMTYEAMFKKIAAEYNLDWRVLAGVAYKESRINPQALGQDFDMGLMQILPSTWDQIAPPLGVSDPYDPYSNALAGAAFLAYLRDYLWDLGYSDERMMLVAYNWGPGNVRRVIETGSGWSGIPAARQKYAIDVLRFARSYPPPGMEARLDQLVEGFPMQ